MKLAKKRLSLSFLGLLVLGLGLGRVVESVRERERARTLSAQLDRSTSELVELARAIETTTDSKDGVDRIVSAAWTAAGGSDRLARLCAMGAREGTSVPTLVTALAEADELRAWLVDASGFPVELEATLAELDARARSIDLPLPEVEMLEHLRERAEREASSLWRALDRSRAEACLDDLGQNADEVLEALAARARARKQLEDRVVAAARVRGLSLRGWPTALDSPILDPAALDGPDELLEGQRYAEAQQAYEELMRGLAQLGDSVEEELLKQARVDRPQRVVASAAAARAVLEWDMDLAESTAAEMRERLDTVDRLRAETADLEQRAERGSVELGKLRSAVHEVCLLTVLDALAEDLARSLEEGRHARNDGDLVAAHEHFGKAVADLDGLSETRTERSRLQDCVDLTRVIELAHSSVAGCFEEVRRAAESRLVTEDRAWCRGDEIIRSARHYRAALLASIDCEESLECWLERTWDRDGHLSKERLSEVESALIRLADWCEEAGLQAARGKALNAVGSCQGERGAQARASASYEAARLIFGRLGDDLWEAESQAGLALCRAPENDGEGSWDEAIRHMTRAAELFGRAGHDEYQRRAVVALATWERPDTRSGGSWEKAAARYAEAAALARKVGSRLDESSALAEQAYSSRPDKDPKGSWSRAAELYRQAFCDRPDALRAAARTLEPTQGRSGDWRAAAMVWEAAAQSYREQGRRTDEFDCVMELADCRSPEVDSRSSWTAVSRVYAEAAGIQAALGDATLEGRLYTMSAQKLLPENNPKGSWEDAGERYSSAVSAFERAGDRSRLAVALHQQAVCLVAGRSANMNDRARQLFERSARASRSLGDVESAEISEAWIRSFSATGEVRIQKTWNNGTEPLGASSYSIGLTIDADADADAERAVVDYRGNRMVLTARGQQFQIDPYQNTRATCTVTSFDVTRGGVAIQLSLRGNTHNDSSVFSGGYNYAFSGSVTIQGQWSDSGLEVYVDDKHAFDGLGNAEWEGRARLNRR